MLAKLLLEYWNPQVEYSHPCLGMGKKNTGAGRLRIKNFCTSRVRMQKVVSVQYSSSYRNKCLMEEDLSATWLAINFLAGKWALR
jgi:hypothetical protein